LTIPHAWRTIEENMNNRFYWAYQNPSPPSGQPVWANIFSVVPDGNYTPTSLVAAINTIINYLFPTQGVTLTYNETLNCITFTNPNTSIYNFKLFANSDLPSIPDFLPDYNSCAENLGILKTTVIGIGQTVNLSGIIIQNVDNIYMTSPSIGSFDTICPFSNNVIKKIPVTVDYGYQIIDQYSATNDYLNCSNQTISSLEFHFRDGYGEYINLKGQNVTFSLVFNKFDSDE